MKIEVSEHAIIRRFERFTSDKPFDNEKIKEEIIYDLTHNVKSRRLKNNDSYLYETDDAYYILTGKNDVYTVITTYGHGKALFEEDCVIMSKVQFTKEESEIVNSIIKNNDMYVVKNIGHKKLFIVNDLLLLVSQDYSRNRIMYNIINKWYIKDLKNITLLDEIKNKYDFKPSEWEDFLKKIELHQYVVESVKIQMIKEAKEESPEIRVYKRVLEGDSKRFPNNFWQEDIGSGIKPASQSCMKYLFEKVLHWSRQDIRDKYCTDILRKYKLGGMLDVLFGGNSYMALDNAYPQIFKPWEMKKIEFGVTFWINKDNAMYVFKQVIQQMKEDGYVLNRDTLLTIKWKEVLRRYKANAIIKTLYNDNYNEFFKNMFDVEYSELEISRYVHEMDTEVPKYSGLIR